MTDAELKTLQMVARKVLGIPLLDKLSGIRAVRVPVANGTINGSVNFTLDSQYKFCRGLAIANVSDAQADTQQLLISLQSQAEVVLDQIPYQLLHIGGAFNNANNVPPAERFFPTKFASAGVQTTITYNLASASASAWSFYFLYLITKD